MFDVTAFHAVIFDLDGVIVNTAPLHSQTIKEVLDPLLLKHGKEPFNPEDDYIKYMDGRSGHDAIGNFLQSREITLPLGNKNDTNSDTLFGLAHLKTLRFQATVEEHGVEIYASSIALLMRLKGAGLKTALASSSKSGKWIIEKIGASEMFEVLVDGKDALKEGLKGKPSPDIFLKAASLLSEQPSKCVIIEDSLPGVEAGKKGGFALVIGINRSNQSEEFKRKGSDIVVKDLSEILIP